MVNLQLLTENTSRKREINTAKFEKTILMEASVCVCCVWCLCNVPLHATHIRQSYTWEDNKKCVGKFLTRDTHTRTYTQLYIHVNQPCSSFVNMGLIHYQRVAKIQACVRLGKTSEIQERTEVKQQPVSCACVSVRTRQHQGSECVGFFSPNNLT